MTSMGVFIYRAGQPAPAAQLVKITIGGSIQDGAIQTEQANVHLSWKLIQAPFSQTEKTFMRRLNVLSSGVGNDWTMRISNWCLQCIENHTAIFRLMQINTSHRHYRKHNLPNRKSKHQISLRGLPIAGFQMSIPNAEERAKVQKILTGNPTVPTQWFQESNNILQFLQPLQPAPLFGFAATPAVPLPQAPATSTVQALSLFIARNLVEHARNQPDAHCPISYEPLQECTDFRVGTCGHVFSEAVASMQTCPLCMNQVAWQRVEINA